MKSNVTSRIRDRIVSGILSGRYMPGDKIPPEREMSQIAKASRVSVRAAYEALSKDGIISRDHGSGTRVASAFIGHGGSPEHIAVLTTLRDPFARDFIEAVQNACNRKDILTILAVTEENTKSQEAMSVRMLMKGVKNMIVWGFDKSLDIRLFERLRICGANLVFFDRIKPGPCADFVALDNKHAIKSLLSDAASSGFSNLAYVDSSGLDVDSNLERRDAFEKECALKNIPFKVFSIPWNCGSSDAKQACHKFFASRTSGLSPAVVCVNDVVAVAVKPHIPEKCGVFSIDGSQRAIALGIRSYAQPVDKMAEASVASIIRQCSNPSKWKAGESRFAS